jgi:cellobiose-specific phosphotransferase system component IIB
MKSFKEYINEGISNILYHTTSYYNATQILSDNKFRLTPIASSDANLNDSHIFYFSCSRIKYSGYTRRNPYVVFELDGRKIANNYSGKPVDYWGGGMRDLALQQALQKKTKEVWDSFFTYDENEDRILTDKSTIENAKKYIKTIHVLLNSKQYNKSIIEIEELAKKNNIPVYFYDELKYFMTQRKEYSIKIPVRDYLESQTEEQKETGKELKSFRDNREKYYREMGLGTIFNLMKGLVGLYKYNGESKKEFIKTIDDKELEAINKYMWYVEDAINLINAEIHNIKTKLQDEKRIDVIKDFLLTVKKSKLNQSDFIKAMSKKYKELK